MAVGERYGAIKRRARLRWWAVPATTRDRLIDAGLELFPVGYHDQCVADILRDRLVVRVRQEYGSILGAILIQLAVSAVVRLLIDWWFGGAENRRVMEAWCRDAVARADIQAR